MQHSKKSRGLKIWRVTSGRIAGREVRVRLRGPPSRIAEDREKRSCHRTEARRGRQRRRQCGRVESGSVGVCVYMYT